MTVEMTEVEVNEYLDSKPGWLILSTIGKEGYPHSVPIGYMRLGAEIYTACRVGSQRAVNIMRNPKVCALFQSGTSRDGIKGVMIQGDATFITEPDEVLRISRESARRRGVTEDELPTEPRAGVAYIRVERRRVISWDYSRG
ncbi:MAG: pyridoxamine 5'-phosphate oxidase family protein [Candidatus Dadabacteria bacterium]|nr:pyridoxamine 5'-phosphate oxidase family protein [Candidatus Dadabacteria bacterium]